MGKWGKWMNTARGVERKLGFINNYWGIISMIKICDLNLIGN